MTLHHKMSIDDVFLILARKFKFRTNKEIAKFLGVTPQNFSDFINGRRKLSRTATGKLLAALENEEGLTQNMILDSLSTRSSLNKSENAGRPVEIDGKRVQIYLDEKSLAIAKRLGNENVSLGIRIALNELIYNQGNLKQAP